jgi:hypothetical protein
VIQVEMQDLRRLKGRISNISDSLITLRSVFATNTAHIAEGTEDAKIRLSEISSLSIVRKSNFNVAWVLIPGAAGALLGLLAGEDEPQGLISFPRGEMTVALGLGLGMLGLSVEGTLEAMKGVDIDIPLRGTSLEERRKILSQIGIGQYVSRHSIQVSTWIERCIPPKGEVTFAKGAKLRMYMTPRSGFEFAYGISDWFSAYHYYGYGSTYDEQSRVENMCGGFFIFLKKKNTINPFVEWGWGKATTSSRTRGQGVTYAGTHSESHLSIRLNIGVEVPLKYGFGLEGSVGDVLSNGGSYYGIVLALSSPLIF